MKVDFYTSAICPRCMFVGHELNKLKEENPELEVDAIEVTLNYRRAWKDGIRVFPALRIDKETLSGMILSRNAIRSFIEKHLQT
ncbi:hypothetical protein DSLASN_45820 [Desulfoluna limicola]|uniref:Thioredoxin n=1 Tax=Desulfoluna limicola TaxID=2810562 RepID=A0ABM7PNH3_9BACT|nr:hypothetical protein [Desulfoluna limicola]BCS98950.1 hypothetical protein DSLASN_45820 [Desulfoluna limicola]